MDDPVGILHRHLGYHEGPGNANIFSTYLHRPPEAWCFDTVTAVYDQSGHRLPVMQAGCAQGAAAVISGVDWAQRHQFWIPSWRARRNDAICFDWKGFGNPDDMHVALVKVPAPRGEAITYIGGNQGDAVSERQVTAGADVVMGAIALSRLLATTPVHVPHARLPAEDEEPVRPHEPSIPMGAGIALPSWQPQWPFLMVKTPLMRSDRVRAWQQRMHDRGWWTVPRGTPYSVDAGAPFLVDGEFGTDTAAVAWAFQLDKRLEVDGKVGPQTWSAARRTDNVTP